MKEQAQVDSRQAWQRLAVAMTLSTIGGSAMYLVSVILPAVQRDFGIARAQASIPYTAMMIGFGIGGLLMGRMLDKYGARVPAMIGSVNVGLGFMLAAASPSIWWFALIHCFVLGMFGSSATFVPLLADTARWFVRRRGIAVALFASGNYLAGALWPPIVQHFVDGYGWRAAYAGMGVFCILTMPLLAWRLGARAPADATPVASGSAGSASATPVQARPFGFSLTQAQALLCIAGIGCCVAMAMPQAHIVAYCTDLGFSAAQGAQMLSLMLGCGIVSRLVSGAICDRIGGLRTLMLGGILQLTALLFFIPFDSLLSLYVISALFGLFQGGIVPSYAIIVREYFPAATAGVITGNVLTATLLGMALGGWMSGKIFDLTGSYNAAFINGIAFNLLNFSIAAFLWYRVRSRSLGAQGAVPQARPS
ncbi:MAG TPA: MFS transporter [Burkholderiales bacterium]|jgi:MFS family permease|nr:MFS transporter [Burkholderiales bacterium]